MHRPAAPLAVPFADAFDGPLAGPRARPHSGPRAVLLGVLLSVLMLLVSAPAARGQGAAHETAPAALTREIKTADSALFAAYNSCAMDDFARFWTPDVEFYHDQGGLMVGRDKVVEAVRNNICRQATRQLVPGTDTVFVMHGYGALHVGVHRFYRYGAEADGPVGEARFADLWKREPDGWKLARVFSYDHRPLK